MRFSGRGHRGAGRSNGGSFNAAKLIVCGDPQARALRAWHCWPSAPESACTRRAGTTRTRALHERVMRAQRPLHHQPPDRSVITSSSGLTTEEALTVSVYEGVVVVVPADVSLQRGVREGRRRSIPVAHNSHLEHRLQSWTTTLDGETGPAHSFESRPTSGPRLARRINNEILAAASPRCSHCSRLPPRNQSPAALLAARATSARGRAKYVRPHRWRL